MSLSYYYKLGFLTACADRGLGPEQAETLASQVLKQANVSLPILMPAIGAGVKVAFSPLGLAAGVVKAPFWLAGKAFQGAGNLGAAAGIGAAHLQSKVDGMSQPYSPGSDSEGDRKKYQEQARLQHLQRMTDELRRRKAELVKTPGLFS